MTFNKLTLRIAWRYLRAPKSHSAVSAIAFVAVAGVAVATAAIVCVLSVFNGFRNLLNDRLDLMAPDVLISPASGKTFENGDSVAQALSDFPGVFLAMPSVSDNALAIAESREMPIRLKGVVPEKYGILTSVDSTVIDGIPVSRFAIGDGAVSVGVANRLGIRTTGLSLMIFAPKREGRVNLSNPLSSFRTDSLNVSSVFQARQNEFDENTVICDISTVRELFQYTNEATDIEIKSEEGVDLQKLTSSLAASLGPDYIVKDRHRQQETNFRMVQIEKWITFLLLIFILFIASFNIISTLCMLIIEKEESMATISALGMKRKDIGRIFWWESMMVCLIGGLGGIILGLGLSLIQQHLGIIKLGGNPDSLLLEAYPVAVEWPDLLMAIIPIIAIGLVTSGIASSFARSRVFQDK